MSIMTRDVFLSNEEYLRQQDLIKDRQLRIIQVREQSKKMAAAILNKMKKEAEQQYQQTENRVLSEIRQHYSRELASVRQHYNQCISDINRQHYVKHISVVNGPNEKKKPPLENSKAERQTDKVESNKSILKNLPASQIKETETDKGVSNFTDMKKSTTPSAIKKKYCKKTSEQTVGKVPHLLKNIVVASEENDIQPSRKCMLPSSFSTSQKKKENSKKSVIFLNKENYEVEKPFTLPMKRYPVFGKKPTCFDFNNTKVNNIIYPNRVFSDLSPEHGASEIYNRLVHDRIRVLEQKEKILRRQSPIPISISNNVLNNKPVRFTEYFGNIHNVPTGSDFSEKPLPASNDHRVDDLPNENINSDLNRVQTKKKLLVLELSNAETQTDKHLPINADVKVDEDSRMAEEEQTTKLKESNLPSAKTSKSTRKTSCPSPIPKEGENSDNKTVNTKKMKNFKSHRCKRKQFRSRGVTVTISNNLTGISTNSSDTNSAVHNYIPTPSSSESNVSNNNRSDTPKAVKVVVNVLSHSEFNDKKSKCLDQRKSVACMIPANHLKNDPNWRKLFDNEEKMTESSYFSPPNVSSKSRNAAVTRSVKTCKTTVKTVNEKKSHDLGYYVHKLLSMRPESVENLDVSSSSTVTIDEVMNNKDKKNDTKNLLKIPLYQNSFDDTKAIKKITKLPYYQNSFDDTMDAVCELMLRDSTPNDLSSVEDSSVDLSSPSSKPKNLSISDSSKFQVENSILDKLKSEKSEDHSKLMQNLSNSSHINSIKSDENLNKNSQDEISEDHIKLPSLDELIKRGFVSELVLNQKYDDEQESMEEEEFLQKLLFVNEKPNNKNDKTASCSNSKVSSHEIMICDSSRSNSPKQLPQKSVDEIDKNNPNGKYELDTMVDDIEKKSHLPGWMGTTVQRTLLASAINSSSGDSSDPLRQTHKVFENLIKEPFENFSESDSISLSEHFALSPIKVPDIHFSIPTVLKREL